MSRIGRLLPVTTVRFLAGYFTPRPAARGEMYRSRIVLPIYFCKVGNLLPTRFCLSLLIP